MLEIVPAILVQSEKEFKMNLHAVENDCSLVQIDILDGTLFKNITWNDAQKVGSIKTDVEIELHLMVENPIPIIQEWMQHVKTLKRVIVHAEMHRPIGSIVSNIKDISDLEIAVAINPETPIGAIEEVIHSIDQLTIMSVHPGFQGQKFGDEQHVGSAESIFHKIEQAKNHKSDLIIEIDGGVTDELIKPLAQSGVNRICAGSLIFKNNEPTKKLIELTETLKTLNNHVK